MLDSENNLKLLGAGTSKQIENGPGLIGLSLYYTTREGMCGNQG